MCVRKVQAFSCSNIAGDNDATLMLTINKFVERSGVIPVQISYSVTETGTTRRYYAMLLYETKD